MKRQKLKTQYPNVRYFEHPTRKIRNGQADRYFTIRYQKNGKSMEECLGWASEGWNAGKAHNILSQVKGNIKTGVGPQSLAEMREHAKVQRTIAEKEVADEKASNMLLQDFFVQFYLPYVERSKRTWRLDEQRFNKIIQPALGERPIRFITQADIQAVINSLVDSGSAPSTIKHYKSILRHIFTIASKTQLHENYIFVGQNPVTDIQTPPVKNARERFLTAHEADAIILAAQKLTSPDLHDCIVLSLNTGLRLGELQRLEWVDVDMNNAIVTVRDEAFRKPGGKVPLNQNAFTIFTTRQLNATKPLVGKVFPPMCGGKLRDNLTHSFKALVDSLNLNEGLAPNSRQHRIVFHTLRHTFASWLAIGGTDIFKIKTLMRHKTITMTMRYAHLIPDVTRDAVNNLKPPKGR